jgi:predicted ATPase/DNA-binding SARP family transcriptional activator
MAVHYGILGPLAMVRDGASVVLSAPKERALLLCLLLSPSEALSAGRLEEALWGERAPSSAAKLVQLYVSNLRKSLGSDAIATSAAGYHIVLDEGSLDSLTFASLLEQARAARELGSERRAARLYTEALSLWRAGVVASDAVPDPLRGDAARLEEQRLECLEERLALLVELGEHDRALPELDTLCAEQPLRERPRAQLMLALYRAGRQAEALAAFRDLRHTLREQLGLEPGEEVRALERAILRQDAALTVSHARVAVARLPLPATELIGRDGDRADLLVLLQRLDVRLISLVGAGGSGKTRLGLAAAADSAELFADGVAFVELAAVREPKEVLPAIASALDVSERRGEPLVQTIAAEIGGRELLLVIDNFEQVVDAGPELVRLLEDAPAAKMLVTSRRVLHLSGEHVFPVLPLADDAAVALFLARTEALDALEAVSAPQLEDIRSICRRLDGLPLAIELAAARVRLLNPRQLLERLDPVLPLLTGGPRDMPARQQTLRETLTWSVALLEPAERQSLAALAVFAGGCSLDAALSVVTRDLDRLGALVDHSLLRRNADPENPRFEMLETIREYAFDMLGRQRERVAAAHAVYFADLVESAELTGPTQRRWLTQLEQERDNLRVALEWAAAAPDVETELRLVGALWRFWWLRGELTEGRNRLEHALARQDGADPSLVAQAVRGAAGIYWNLGEAGLARDHASLGLQLAAAAGEPVVELSCHTVLGLLARDQSDFGRARDHFEKSAAIATQLGRDRDVMVAKMNLGSVAFGAREYSTAQTLWQDLLAYHRRGDSEEGIAIALLNLGLVAYRLDQRKAARPYFSEASDLFIRLGFREHHAHALQGLAALDSGDGEPERAARLLGEASRVLAATRSGETTFDAELAREAEADARARLGDDRFAAAFNGE